MRALSIAIIAMFVNLAAYATPSNIAPQAKVSASSYLSEDFGPDHVIDGIIMEKGKGEWACKGYVHSWGVMYLPWVQLDWEKPVKTNKIRLYDRPDINENLIGGTLHFSDGSTISVTAIPVDGSAKEITFPTKEISWVKFEATDGEGKDIGLSEFEVYQAQEDFEDYVSWVDPYIETTRGRWFYCTPGARPFGMVAAAAYTRNKNQGGGGYNYNSMEIRGFNQINDWMISGVNIMPNVGDVEVGGGEESWKSAFKHENEVIQPGYHKLFLERYNVWTEYTATERVSFYRMNYVDAEVEPRMIVDLGSKLGNATMTEADLKQVSDQRLVGSLKSVDRFWGGPDSIDVYCVVEFDHPIQDADSWVGDALTEGKSSVKGNEARLNLKFQEGIGTLKMKIGISFTSVENAIYNLENELSHWDFDKVKSETQLIWNEKMAKIDVQGGTIPQKTKFYTDLWHVLLGRHIINDANGYYPDYTHGEYVDKRTSVSKKVRKLPMDKNGKAKFNMYSFDALWLTQWNLNVLWGLAWPEVLDDFSACLVQYAKNGKLLPRGACVGGYSFIMTGTPASNMLSSAIMKDLLTKAKPADAFKLMKSNHLPGGMMSFESSEDLEFYIKNGWCPDNAGKTIEWAFQDWGLAQVAVKLGKKSDAREFERRSKGWKQIFREDQKLLFPKTANGQWLHDDPLNGSGWIEANAWQGTWGISHAIPQLVDLMGGKDQFSDKLNHAFEQAEGDDFVFGYSDGYVSYANQPGCSNAHVFSHAGKPYLTQYWVRKVNEQAYGGITPDKGYGGHDEDQGQMGGVSALMSIGLFDVKGSLEQKPKYDITSPVFDQITIQLNSDYYSGESFVIKTHNNSKENMYIQSVKLNGDNHEAFQFSHDDYTKGGLLEIWLGDQPNKDWGKPL
ncbi:GH92 family glycosyl hydrolase [Aureibacter tunicatorum]|uniref:Alpha-1,2-mannosidase n=1 Tax=Aureibacter tunicatorum TaxID=866807 RepID=A0AAE4BQU7_9BACT|nr:GH92 family glycosyl hydrolase [Aureibacter tunicatorum]MDR6237283.1 putative alpha-1,2-mannosidase [Aureibacter tunicatorum]BDD06274.1 hypothetical protein AUTU_37570 [Aureibacter tunicatorum]